MMRTLRTIVIDTMTMGGLLGTREIPIGLGTPAPSALTRRCGKPVPSRRLSGRQVTVSTGGVTRTHPSRPSGLPRMAVVTAGTGGPMKTAREGAWNAREGAWKKKAPTRIAS
jgi:hypothetical protein